MEMMQITEHRPWPMPAEPWRVKMRWHDLLFAHWPVPVERLRALIPRPLDVDTFDGTAWLGVVPFWMSGIRLHGMPAIPTTHTFAELNVRTYVTDGRKPGVWFFSLDAASRIAAAVARKWYGLNYRHARMSCGNGDGWLHYNSHRSGGGAAFSAQYRAASEPFAAARGSIEHWLCERYCMYMGGGSRPVYRGEIHHKPWSLHRAEARIDCNTMAGALDITLPAVPPHLLYVHGIDAVAWGPGRVT